LSHSPEAKAKTNTDRTLGIPSVPHLKAKKFWREVTDRSINSLAKIFVASSSQLCAKHAIDNERRALEPSSRDNAGEKSIGLKIGPHSAAWHMQFGAHQNRVTHFDQPFVQR